MFQYIKSWFTTDEDVNEPESVPLTHDVEWLNVNADDNPLVNEISMKPKTVAEKESKCSRRAPRRKKKKSKARKVKAVCSLCGTRLSKNQNFYEECEIHSVCEVCITDIRLCHRCDTKICVYCSDFFESSVLSSNWKGREKTVEFCSLECAKISLKKCQRSNNTIYRMHFSSDSPILERTVV